jgi:hypothetical protein
MTTIVKENVEKTARTIKGSFELSDGTRTQFTIDMAYGWNQRGNSTENLQITVPRIEELEKELYL